MKSKVNQHRKLFDSPWLKVFEAEASINGTPQAWTFCSRDDEPYHSKATPNAVIIVPIVSVGKENCLMLTKEFRASIGDYEYGFPAGLVETGEDPLEAAKRELLEETGYCIDGVIAISPPNLYSSSGITNETFQYVFAYAEYEQAAQCEATEDIEILLLTVQEIGHFLANQPPLSSRAWPICYMYQQLGILPEKPSIDYHI